METSFRNKKTLVYNNMLNVEYYFLIKKKHFTCDWTRINRSCRIRNNTKCAHIW